MQLEDSPAAIPSTGVSAHSQRRVAWQQMRPAGAIELWMPADAGWEAGSVAVDSAIDRGAGVLLIIDEERPSIAARAIAALYAGGDATSVIPSGVSDLEWMQQCTDVRNEMVQLRALLGDPATLLANDPLLACQVAAIVQSASRRTPVVIVGAVPHIAAMAAIRIAAQSGAWVFIALRDDDAAAEVARKRLAITPWAALEWKLGPETRESMVRSLVEDLDALEQPAER